MSKEFDRRAIIYLAYLPLAIVVNYFLLVSGNALTGIHPNGS